MSLGPYYNCKYWNVVTLPYRDGLCFYCVKDAAACSRICTINRLGGMKYFNSCSSKYLVATIVKATSCTKIYQCSETNCTCNKSL